MFNPMERIRKLSNMPAMPNGYPPSTHRKCSDWSSYSDATDTVCRELVDQLLQCQQSAMKIATSKALLAGEKADLIEKLRLSDKNRGMLEADRVGIAAELPVDVRQQIGEAIEGNVTADKSRR